MIKLTDMRSWGWGAGDRCEFCNGQERLLAVTEWGDESSHLLMVVCETCADRMDINCLTRPGELPGKRYDFALYGFWR